MTSEYSRQIDDRTQLKPPDPNVPIELPAHMPLPGEKTPPPPLISKEVNTPLKVENRDTWPARFRKTVSKNEIDQKYFDIGTPLDWKPITSRGLEKSQPNTFYIRGDDNFVSFHHTSDVASFSSQLPSEEQASPEKWQYATSYFEPVTYTEGLKRESPTAVFHTLLVSGSRIRIRDHQGRVAMYRVARDESSSPAQWYVAKVAEEQFAPRQPDPAEKPEIKKPSPTPEKPLEPPRKKEPIKEPAERVAAPEKPKIQPHMSRASTLSYEAPSKIKNFDRNYLAEADQIGLAGDDRDYVSPPVMLESGGQAQVAMVADGASEGGVGFIAAEGLRKQVEAEYLSLVTAIGDVVKEVERSFSPQEAGYLAYFNELMNARIKPLVENLILRAGDSVKETLSKYANQNSPEYKALGDKRVTSKRGYLATRAAEGLIKSASTFNLLIQYQDLYVVFNLGDSELGIIDPGKQQFELLTRRQEDDNQVINDFLLVSVEPNQPKDSVDVRIKGGTMDVIAGRLLPGAKFFMGSDGTRKYLLGKFPGQPVEKYIYQYLIAATNQNAESPAVAFNNLVSPEPTSDERTSIVLEARPFVENNAAHPKADVLKGKIRELNSAKEATKRELESQGFFTLDVSEWPKDEIIIGRSSDTNNKSDVAIQFNAAEADPYQHVSRHMVDLKKRNGVWMLSRPDKSTNYVTITRTDNYLNFENPVILDEKGHTAQVGGSVEKKTPLFVLTVKMVNGILAVKSTAGKIERSKRK